MLTVFAQVSNHRIGELFPTPTLMRTGLVRLNSEGGVEHQHALLCPASKVTACGNRRACVGVDFLENVLQRWRKRHTVVHRETEPMRLPRLVIRILTDNHYFHLVERRGIKCRKYLRARRENLFGGIFLLYKFGEIGKVWLIPFLCKLLIP